MLLKGAMCTLQLAPKHQILTVFHQNFTSFDHLKPFFARFRPFFFAVIVFAIVVDVSAVVVAVAGVVVVVAAVCGAYCVELPLQTIIGCSLQYRYYRMHGVTCVSRHIMLIT